MSDSVAVVVIAAAALTANSLFIWWNTRRLLVLKDKVEEVHKEVNGQTQRLIEAREELARLAGHAEGMRAQQEIDKNGSPNDHH